MATTSTRRTIRRALMDDLRDEYRGGVPGLGVGVYFTATAPGTATTIITNDPVLNPSTTPAEAFRFHWIYRPALTTQGAGQLRRANTVTFAAGVATITHYGPDQTDLTDTVAELWIPELNPLEIDRIISDALEYIFSDYTTLLTLPFADHDQAASGVTDWTAVTAALSKVTAAGNVPYQNVRALRTLNSAANGYAESGPILVSSDSTALLMGFSRNVVGTNVLRLQGTSASIDSISNGESAFQLMWKQVDIGTNESVTLRLENSSATGDAYWGAVGLLPVQRGTIILPSWVNNRFKLKAVAEVQTSYSPATDVYDAASLQLGPRLRENLDYRYVGSTFAANPHQIELLRTPTRPWVIIGTRPHSDIESFTDDNTSTTTADLHIVLATTKWLLGKRYPKLFPDFEAKYGREVLALTRLREPALPTRLEHRMI